MDMKAAMEALAPAATGKNPEQNPQRQLYTDLPYLKGEACRKYLSRYIDFTASNVERALTPGQQDEIVRMVSGRARLSAQYAGYVLASGNTDLLGELDNFVKRVTEARDSSPKENFQAMIKNLFQRSEEQTSEIQ